MRIQNTGVKMQSKNNTIITDFISLALMIWACQITAVEIEDRIRG